LNEEERVVNRNKMVSITRATTNAILRHYHTFPWIARSQVLPAATSISVWPASTVTASNNNSSSTNVSTLTTISRYFSTKQNKTESAHEIYVKAKQELKELRTRRYAERQAHKEVVKRRRDGRPRGVLKDQFNDWFQAKKKRENIQDRKARKLGIDWKIQVAVVLERLPVVLPDKQDWERDWDNLRSYLDQFGREYPESFVGENEIEPEEDLTDEALLGTYCVTVQHTLRHLRNLHTGVRRDCCPLIEEEKKIESFVSDCVVLSLSTQLVRTLPTEKYLPRGYTPAPRETEADANGDVRTLDRRLKTWVYLTVKDSAPNDSSGAKWQFPTVEVKDDETLLEAAKRAIVEKVGSKDAMEIYYPSGAPMAVDMKVFSQEERAKHGNTFGMKTFFMVVQYDDGKVSSENITVDDFAWLEKDEVVERVAEEQGENASMLYRYLLKDQW